MSLIGQTCAAVCVQSEIITSHLTGFGLHYWNSIYVLEQQYDMRTVSMKGWSVGILGALLGMLVLAWPTQVHALTGDSATLNQSVTNNSTVTNSSTSTTQSGDATVSNNGDGGNATTGSASSTATLISVVNSLTNNTPTTSSNGWQTSITNVDGNQTGDVDLPPPTTTAPDSNSADPSGSTNNTTTSTTQNTTTLNNIVNATTQSGNASVTDNQQGGNATTGSANADANVVNVVDSNVNDEGSFLDIVNISGNLTGNIEVPEDLVNNTAALPNVNCDTATTTLTNNVDATNAVNQQAQSGQATVSGNTEAGSATSGNASTNLNVYNLINNDVSGGNLLIVIINNPDGPSVQILGEPNVNNAVLISPAFQSNSTLTVNNNVIINNVINLDATSGNALVSDNTQAGNAASGNASTRANIINLVGDNVSLSGWLGILIINVFGSWTGSITGPSSVSTANSSTQGSTASTVENSVNTSSKKRIVHVHHHNFFITTSGIGGTTLPTTIASTTTTPSKSVIARVFHLAQPKAQTSNKSDTRNTSFNYAPLATIVVLIALGLVIAQQVIVRRDS